ncbi:hypothetical protein KAU11_10385 [Candidatus Babeliales bacterium]|nr:hypothetical protein [Candidatus Babeliales bacterium]
MRSTAEESFEMTKGTNVADLISKMGRWFRTIVYELLTAHYELLKSDDDERTVIVEIKVQNQMLAKLHKFYRGAVVEYYWRQTREIWDPRKKMDTELRKMMHDEIRKGVRFFRYDEAGQVDGLNSFDTFRSTKAFTEKLNTIEAVLFDDEGYQFPVSEEYLTDYKKYGKAGADKKAVAKLLDWNKNQHKGGRIG